MLEHLSRKLYPERPEHSGGADHSVRSVSLFGPIYSLINMFIYILHNPQSPESQSDLALMDVGSGYFARLRVSTDSQISITLAKEMALLATQYLNEPQQGAAQDSALNSQPPHLLNKPKERAAAGKPMPTFESSLELDTVSAFVSGTCHQRRVIPDWHALP